MTSRPAIVSTGSSVPATIRANDDPVFDWLHANPPPHQDLFEGYEQRRVLAAGEKLSDLMLQAAQTALQRASLSADDVDVLLGYASIGTWEMPNDLVVVAKELGLPPGVPIVPVNNEYANFPVSLLLGDALIAGGRAERALVVVGANWARYVDYHTPPSVSAGDGAGAAVMASSDDPKSFAILDVVVDSAREFLGGMYVAADATTPPVVPPTYRGPVFHLNELGVTAFETFGLHRPPALVQEVLARHNLTPADIAFVGHQTSTVLNGAWQQALKPQQFIQTLTTYANMTSASIPVNLDVCAAEITADHVALVGLGPEPSCTVVLLARQTG